jgi:hypothetical protein
MVSLTVLAAVLPVEAAESAGTGVGMRIFGAAVAVLGLLAVCLSIYLRYRPGRISARPYRPPGPPYGPPPGSDPGGERPPRS